MSNLIVKRVMISWVVGVVLVFLAHSRAIYVGESFFDPDYWQPCRLSNPMGEWNSSYIHYVGEFWSDCLRVLPAYAFALILPIAALLLVRWIVQGKKRDEAS